MSLLRRLSNSDKFVIKNAFLTTNAFYSSRSKTEELESFYKYVSQKVKDKSEYEGGPNWEIFNPKGNRFYLQSGGLGPAWQSSKTTVDLNASLYRLLDFELKPTKNSSKLHFTIKRCPKLLHENIQELFSVVSGELTLITLSSRTRNDTEIENSAKNFVIAAREICRRLVREGYWADFINPFSSKPFYSQTNNANLFNIDKRFHVYGLKYEEPNKNCIVTKADVEGTFSGSIVTTAPNDSKKIVKLLVTHNDLIVELQELMVKVDENKKC